MLTIIGDVHGKYERYNRITKRCDYSVQIGDLGFDYTKLTGDASHHKFFPGNHDNYDVCFDSPHCLGDYGQFSLSNVDFFFIRGGFSIDKEYRIQHERDTGYKCWWEEEQITSPSKIESCIKDYSQSRPKIVLSHSCPREIAQTIGKPFILKQFGFNPDNFTTKTQDLLQTLFEIHQPDLWVFGHFHTSTTLKVGSTKFVCLNELETITI